MASGWKVVTVTGVLLAVGAVAQTQQAGKQSQEAPNIDKAAAYYHYSLGHLYAELAASYNNRGDYFNKAIENYRAALKADPTATFLSEELSDLYIQSGRLREAVTDAEDILKQNPNDLNARRILARIYSRLSATARPIALTRASSRRPSSSIRKSPSRIPRTPTRG